MNVVKHPAACDVCTGKLSGAAEIALERENDGYFINVRQMGRRDWGICPKCGRVACYAECWNKKRDRCNFCPVADPMGDCPQCGKPLVGAIEVVQTKTNGMQIIRLVETTDRNWIECDSCSLVICKSCCRKPQSGYCNECLSRICPAVNAEQKAKAESASGGQEVKYPTLLDALTGEAADLFKSYERQNANHQPEQSGRINETSQTQNNKHNNNRGGQIR